MHLNNAQEVNMWEYNYTNYNYDELYHYGVKGMKWKNHIYATREELLEAKKKYKADKHEQRVIRRQAKKIARRDDEVRSLKYDMKRSERKARRVERAAQEFIDDESNSEATRFFGGLAGAGAAIITRKQAQEARAKYEEAYNATYNKALKDLQKQSASGKSQVDKVMSKKKK